MAALQSRAGKPRAYRLECRGQPLIQHAVMTCAKCHREESYVYNKPESPEFIEKKFKRNGWIVYQSKKTLCPECSKKRKQEEAFFARQADMQTPAQFNLIKNDKRDPPKPEESPAEPPQPNRQVYLVIVGEDGAPSIRTLESAQRMLFGERVYLCIPDE